MTIKPSAAIRNDYNGISELCKATGRPVYLTKNGEGDLVVMDIVSFTQRESMLELREQLIVAEEERQSGKPGYGVSDVASMMKAAIQEVIHGAK